MEIPIYLTFKEFEENYSKDLKKWLKHYEDSEELEFLEEVERKYRGMINNPTIKVIKNGEVERISFQDNRTQIKNLH